MADDPSRVEVCAAADPDDVPDVAGVDVLHVTPSRYGYRNLHLYYNDLAGLAAGRWHLLWNDDAVMVTPGWDSVVAERHEEVLLWPYVPQEQGMNCFPIWPASWFRLMGHVSLNTFNDRWMIDVAERTGRHRHVEIVISHQRVGDEVTSEAGSSADVATFDQEPMRLAREADARAIAGASGDAWNKDLVSVLLPGEGRLPQIIQRLCGDAARPGDLEFLVAAGDAHLEVRRSLEDAGLMGRTEVHVDGAVADVAQYAHGGCVVWWDSTLAGAGWDEAIRGPG